MPQIANGAFSGDPSNMWDTPTVWTEDFMARAATQPRIAHWYQDWYRATRKDWDADKVDLLTARGELPLISWAPRNPEVGTSDTTYNHASIVGGNHDAYIDDWATQIAAYGKVILLRPMWEMNLTVYNWGIGVQSQTNTTYINAYRYLVDAFDALDADNVRWVWAPFVSASHTSHAAYYPGDAYVDYVAMDGYNNQASTTWQTFSQIFGGSYTNLTGTVAPTKPLLVTEFAAMETNGDKAAWITDAYAKVQTDYPKIRGLVYFDADFTSAGEKDWSLESTTTARDAYRAVADDPENLNALETGIQFVEATSTTASGVASITGNLPASADPDDPTQVMIAVLGKGQYYTYATVPTGWTKFIEETDTNNLNGGNARLEVFWKRPEVGEDTTPTWTVTDPAGLTPVHVCSILLFKNCLQTGDPFEAPAEIGGFSTITAGSTISCPEVITTAVRERIIGVIFTRMASASPANANYAWANRFTEWVENTHLTAGVNASTLGVAESLALDPETVTPSATIANAQDRHIAASFALIPMVPEVERVVIQPDAFVGSLVNFSGAVSTIQADDANWLAAP